MTNPASNHLSGRPGNTAADGQHKMNNPSPPNPLDLAALEKIAREGSAQSQPSRDEGPTASLPQTQHSDGLADLDPTHWEVEVRVCGETVLTIGSHGYLAGFEDIDRYGDAVRAASEHLASFIGTGEPMPCFACGGSGQERWMGYSGEEVGPCSVCQPQGEQP